jgi:hypothetical protein
MIVYAKFPKLMQIFFAKVKIKMIEHIVNNRRGRVYKRDFPESKAPNPNQADRQTDRRTT